jgi:hypothetical protein
MVSWLAQLLVRIPTKCPPVLSVIEMASGIVANSPCNIRWCVRQAVNVLQQLRKSSAPTVIVVAQGDILVEVVDSSLVVLGVVQGHGLGIDEGLDGVVCVTEFWEGERLRLR